MDRLCKPPTTHADGIRLTPILVGLALFISACSPAAVCQWLRLSAAGRFPPDILPELHAARNLPWAGLAIAGVVIGVLLFAWTRFGALVNLPRPAS